MDQPDYGYILDVLVVDEGSPILLSELIKPRIEAEIGFVTVDVVQCEGEARRLYPPPSDEIEDLLK